MSWDELQGSYPIQKIDESTYYLEKPNWQYSQALKFQLQAIQAIRQHREKQLFIFTSHPNVFTMGRGLQRDAKKKGLELQQLTEEQKKHLPYELYDIDRGGGLTFHHPGQLVLYPIVNLTGKKIKLFNIVHGLLELAKRTLEHHYNLNRLSHHRELLGLWFEHQKIASVGVGLKHFVNHHGMAINIYPDQKMQQAIKRIAPCGLHSKQYTSLSQLLHKNNNHSALLDEFRQLIIGQFKEYRHQCWQEDFWRER